MGQFVKLYNTRRWKELRLSQLMKQPLCERCLRECIIRPATVVHHKTPHKGDLELFHSRSNLASSCADCHNVDEKRLEGGRRARQSIDVNGWPKNAE